MKSKIIRIGVLALIIIFFIPFFSVSCSNQTISISGLAMTFGKDVQVMGQTAGRQSGNFAMILLILIPAVVAAIAFSKKFIKIEGIIAGISSIVYLLVLYAAYSSIKEKASQSYAVFRPEIGFYLALLINLAIIGVVAYDMYTVKAKNNAVPIAKAGNVPVNQAILFCENCGAKISGGAPFCSACGSKTRIQ